MTRWRRLGAVIAVGVALVSCGGDDGDEPAATTAGPASTTSTTLAPSPEDQAAVEALGRAEVVLTEIGSFTQPTNLVARSGDPHLYVTERAGTIRRIRVETPTRGAPRYTVERSPVLDLSGDIVSDNQEQGLLGLVFSSDGRAVFVAYTNAGGDQQLDRFAMTGDRIDARSRTELLVIPDDAGNHNGGQLAFGPDGFLYWGMGDGGGQAALTTGQDPADLLGSVLRIDPDGGDPYGIPPSNPFATGGGAGEVWAYGLRNPWRFSFDRDTGDLWIGDVGQGEREEIDLLPADAGGGRGANLGWSLREGDLAFEGGAQPADGVEPVLAYGRDRGCSVIGGYVYRGTAIAELAGAYLYSDACNGEVRALVARDTRLLADRGLGVSATAPSSFGQNGSGELYVVSLDGPVYRIDPKNPPATTTTR